MPAWQPFHGWMRFDHLTEKFDFVAAFTIAYRFRDDGNDQWTARFNRFKDGKRNALRAGSVVFNAALPDLLRGLTLNPAQTAFLPVLSSHESVATDKNPLWRIARYCAGNTGASFVGGAVTKNPHPSLHNATDAQEREAILAQAAHHCRRIQALNIFIFDDFVTRGSTLSHTASAIRASNPRTRIYGVSLGKAETLAYHRNTFDRDLSNDHVPLKWNRLWTQHDA